MQPNVWQSLGAVEMKNVLPDAFPPNTRVTCLPVGTGSFRYLMVDCTQEVYQFNTQTRILERLDKTFYRGYNCHSTKFLRRDTLYSVGGYGFWHTNNILSYYKSSNHEWESVNPIANAPQSIYQGFNGYLPKNDCFFSALSLYQNDSENKGVFTWSDSVYAYSFRKKTWERLGQLTQEFRQQIPDDFIEKATWFQLDSYFILKYYKSPQTFFLLVDPIRNEARMWRDTRKLLANLSDTYDNNIPGSYVWNNALYFRRYATGVTGKTVEIISLPMASLWKESSPIGAFYKPINTGNSRWLYGLLGALAILGLGTIVWLRKPGNSSLKAAINSQSDTLYPDSLNQQERLIFDALLKASPTTGLTADDLNELLQINEKAPDNQRKIRAEVIKGMNFKLKHQWKIDEAVMRIPTTLDRRIYTYILNEQVLNRIQTQAPR